jgi:hypothetical protein
LAGASGSAVDAGAHPGKYFWHILDFVKNSRRLHGIEKPLWIGAETRHDVRIFE